MQKLRIALAGLKGGIGKTTLSMVLGSILQRTYGKKVCYVDGDYFQYPLTAQKQREKIFFERNTTLTELLFESQGIDLEHREVPTVFKMSDGFEVKISPEEIERQYPDFDIYIYDFMGSQGYEDTYKYLTRMDYIILPTVIDSVNARPTFYWMSGITFGLNLMKKEGKETRTKDIFLLFNSFNDEDCDFSLKSWLEDQARKFQIKTLQNTVKHFPGVARDITSVTEDNPEFFTSLELQPSDTYCDQTNILQVVEEFLIMANIITEKKVTPQVIDDATVLHRNIIEDLKQQLSELNDLTVQANGTLSTLSEKHQAILDTYNNLCSMTLDEIHELFGRKVVSPNEENTEQDPVAPGTEEINSKTDDNNE